LKHFKIHNLISFYLPKKKITIVDCGCHKGEFLKKIGLDRLKSGYLIDPLDYKISDKLKLKNFNYFQISLGATQLKKQRFNIYSDKYPEWSSINQLGIKSIYKKKYSKYLKKNFKTKFIKRTTLDKVLKKNKDNIDILKIDCQSTSLEILKGAKKNLNNKKFKIIFVAINLSEFYKNKNDSLIDIAIYLKKFGYEFINIANAHNGKLGKLDYDFSNFKIWTFDAIFIQKNYFK